MISSCVDDADEDDEEDVLYSVENVLVLPYLLCCLCCAFLFIATFDTPSSSVWTQSPSPLSMEITPLMIIVREMLLIGLYQTICDTNFVSLVLVMIYYDVRF